jgi:hypothetical protein
MVSRRYVHSHFAIIMSFSVLIFKFDIFWLSPYVQVFGPEIEYISSIKEERRKSVTANDR